MSYGTVPRAEVRPIFKLVSSKDTLLGSVTFPGPWEAQLERAGYINFMAEPRFDVRQTFGAMAADEAPTIRHARIANAPWSKYAGAVVLHGITLEEFEKLDGCTFSPGAGYLRSLVEGG